MSMGTEMPTARTVSIPEGTTEYVERKTRTVYLDGTIVETEPERIGSRGQAMTWAKVADMFAGIQRPPGTVYQQFTRKVTTIAEPWIAESWTEAVPDERPATA